MIRLIISVLMVVLFTGTAMSQPEIMDYYIARDTVPVYDKYEIAVRLKADFVNPFDPDEIDLTGYFQSPSGDTVVIHGFYNYSSWRWQWMFRFAPMEEGLWNYYLVFEDSQGTTTLDSMHFLATEAASHGPIRVSANNNRYLEHADGTPFYGVGFWYNDGYNAFNQGRIQPDVLDELQSLGVNFISTYITPLETFASGLGRYEQSICGRLDEVLEMCEARHLQLSLNLWFHSYLSESIWGGGNIRWDTNPYSTICHAQDFFRNKLAWEYQEKLYRYFIARWGYSRSLALWFIVDEVNGTDAWAAGDTMQAAEWGRQVHDYFKANDPYQHLTTGTRSGGFTQYWKEGYATFDIAGREIYEAQGFPIITEGTVDSAGTHPLKLSYDNYAGEIQRLWEEFEKPAIIAETGWDHTFYEPGMPGYHAQYHNALWVSLATGSCMTPFWWAYSSKLNDVIVSQKLTSIRRFSDQIFSQPLINPEPYTDFTADADAFLIRAGDLMFGWMVDPAGDVVDDAIQISCDPGAYRLRLYHTWRGRFIVDQVIEAQEGEVRFTVPRYFIEGTHANYVGQDVAFILEKQ